MLALLVVLLTCRHRHHDIVLKPLEVSRRHCSSTNSEVVSDFRPSRYIENLSANV